MNLPSDFRDALIEAKNMNVQGKFLEAERIYRALAAPGPPVPWLDPTDEAIPCAD